jgi:hypothetical protein
MKYRQLNLFEQSNINDTEMVNKMKTAFENSIGEEEIKNKDELEGKPIEILDIRQIAGKFSEVNVYTARLVSTDEHIAFFGGSVIDKQEIKAGDILQLKKRSGNAHTYWYAEAIKL